MVSASRCAQSAPRVRKSPPPHTAPKPASPVAVAPLHRWREFPAAIAAPYFELTAEEFIPILNTFKTLRAAGERFDPMFVALMTVLERQLIDGGDDADSDVDHADFENDDPDEEAVQAWEAL